MDEHKRVVELTARAETAEREVFEHHREFQPYIARALAAESRLAEMRAKVEEVEAALHDAAAVIRMADRSRAWAGERERCLARLDALLAPAGERKENDDGR